MYEGGKLHCSRVRVQRNDDRLPWSFVGTPGGRGNTSKHACSKLWTHIFIPGANKGATLPLFKIVSRRQDMLDVFSRAREVRTFAFGRLVYATRRGWWTPSPGPMSSHVLLLLVLLLLLLLVVLRLPLTFGRWWPDAVLWPVLGAHLHQEVGRHQATDPVALTPVKTVVVHFTVYEYGLTHLKVQFHLLEKATKLHCSKLYITFTG